MQCHNVHKTCHQLFDAMIQAPPRSPSALELAYCGLFGAAALLLPALFHVVRLGHVFMPMYLPLVTLAFFVRPAPAAATALLVPLLSGAVTGMPPFYPPVAVFMSLELAVMAGLIAAVVSRRPKIREWAVLVPVLLLGRILYVGLVYAFSLAVELPAGFLAGLSVVAGWPGIVMMLLVVPPVAKLRRGRATPAKTSRKDPKSAYFDSIAAQWDGWEDLPALDRALAVELAGFSISPEEAVLDVGCGTGNLTRAILSRLSASGRVTAVDISPRMIGEARRKIPDPRADWLVADVRRLPVAPASIDRVFCFSVWPHIDDPDEAAEEIGRVLKPGGLLYVWHASPRARINEIHASAGDDAIRGDVLPPACETADLLRRHGFRPTTVIDDEVRYLVVVRYQGRGAEKGREAPAADACDLA